MRQATRNKYVMHNVKDFEDEKFSFFPFYEVTLNPIMKSVKLLINVGFKIFKNHNVLEEINEKKGVMSSIRALCEGRIVLTCYNHMSYKVKRVDFDKTPDFKFLN